MTYRSEIARQPDSVRDSVAAARREAGAITWERFAGGAIGVTGIGASFAAALVVAAEFRRRGRRAHAMRAVDLVGSGDPADILLALSHRGRSVEIVEALRTHPGSARIAVTNDPASPLAQAAEAHIRLANGTDATPSTTGYTATLAACGVLAEHLCGAAGAGFGDLPERIAGTLAVAAASMPRLAETFRDRRAIDVVGGGAALGTAEEGVLLLREAARLPAASFDTRHFLHGPMEALDSRSGVVVFGSGREVALAENLRDIGVPTLLVTSDEDIREAGPLTVIRVPAEDNLIARGIVDILPVQLLAAMLSDAAGLTDTKFRYRQTDTKIAAA